MSLLLIIFPWLNLYTFFGNLKYLIVSANAACPNVITTLRSTRSSSSLSKYFLQEFISDLYALFLGG